jgi:predicted  nucleic acid-binding Zn-ribbon protein
MSADLFATLKGTINSISGKVDAVKAQATGYKQSIQARLNQINETIQTLLKDPMYSKLANIQQTQQQLQAAQQELQTAQQELQTAQQQLQESTEQVQQLQQQLDEVNKQIDDLKKELANAQSENGNLKTQNEELTAQKEQLTEDLRVLQEQQSTFVEQIAAINDALAVQIQKIDALSNELPDNDFSEQFTSISNNIAAIIRLINEGGPSAPSAPPSSPGSITSTSSTSSTSSTNLPGQALSREAIDILNRYNLKRNMTKDEAEQVPNAQVPSRNEINYLEQKHAISPEAVYILLKKRNEISPGTRRIVGRGRRVKRRVTRKKRKQRGGYVYGKENSVLERSSSVVTSSPSSLSKTRSKKYKVKARGTRKS